MRSLVLDKAGDPDFHAYLLPRESCRLKSFRLVADAKMDLWVQKRIEKRSRRGTYDDLDP